MYNINGKLYKGDITAEEFKKMSKEQQDAVKKEHNDVISQEWQRQRKAEQAARENDAFFNNLDY